MKFTSKDFSEAKLVMHNFQKPKTGEEIFYNLCFCLMVPQATFKNCMVALDKLKEHDFYTWSGFPWSGFPSMEEEVQRLIKLCRFYNRKAHYLILAKKNFSSILYVLQFKSTFQPFSLYGPFTNEFKRNWLVKNIKGLGMKTASHLLRNMGATNLAIVDTHILKYLKVNGEKWDYMDLERRLEKRAKRYGCSMAVLDIVVWKHYSKTEWSDYTY